MSVIYVFLLYMLLYQSQYVQEMCENHSIITLFSKLCIPHQNKSNDVNTACKRSPSRCGWFFWFLWESRYAQGHQHDGWFLLLSYILSPWKHRMMILLFWKDRNRLTSDICIVCSVLFTLKLLSYWKQFVACSQQTIVPVTQPYWLAEAACILLAIMIYFYFNILLPNHSWLFIIRGDIWWILRNRVHYYGV